MKELAIDIETYCPEDLTKCGVYRYAEHPRFAVLLFAYAVDGAEPAVVDLASGEHLPEDVLDALTDPAVFKTAYNAAFERICLSRWLGLPPGQYLDAAQWDCTMVAAARCGLPLGLDACCQALKLGQDQAKLKEGKALVKLYSKDDNKGRQCLPDYQPDKWARFKEYCRRDVVAEQAVRDHVCGLKVPDEERAMYAVDQRINDRGVAVDILLCHNAIEYSAEIKERLVAEGRAISGLENPASTAKLIPWLKEHAKVDIQSLRRADFDELRKQLEHQPAARRLVDIRAEVAKTSTAKYNAILSAVCADGRVRGLTQFCGAARTGRWAGRLVQMQNLPQNHLEDIGDARARLKNGDLDIFELFYPQVNQTLSELVRTAFVAEPGNILHVCDFSAIEARVIAWLAGEQWVLDTFAQGGDIYCATASKMFGVPVVKHGVNGELRQKGKIATLALGYGGGPRALEAMGAGRMGLDEYEERDIVDKWREANPAIVKLWRTLEQAAIRVASGGRAVTVNRGIRFAEWHGAMTVTLPSGRALVYPRARVESEPSPWGKEPKDGVTYEAVNQLTRQWGRTRTYGGKLAENVVQAVARDILAEVLRRADNLGLRTVFHVHDEIIVEAPEDLPLAAVTELFNSPPDWAKDLPLSGAGYSTKYYLKD